MSQRGKRPMPENEAFPPTKKRKGRPSSSQTSTAYVEEDPNPNSSNSNVSPSQTWQPRSLMDLKMSSIYNRSAAEAPAELFRKDLISAMKLPDSEPLSVDEYWVISDQWKQEWERGVQVPVNPDSLPEPVTQTRRTLYEKGRSDFKLPKNKFIHVMKTDNFSHDQHYLSNTPALADSVCFYDLDQSDDAWLKLYNRERNPMGLSPVTEEQFERVIEELESRCWNKIHAIMKNEEGLGIEFDENVICDVCRSPDSEEANEMVFCDNCNICVHQACYGITAIPSGQWLCRTCSMGQKPDCVLCPNKGGAMKSTRSGQKWAHVSCALWIPEVSIGSVDRMEPITKISNIPQSRWALICVLCRERVGACIQCSVKTCKTAYHVTCAFQHGLEMRAIIEDESAEDGVKLRSYCQKHGVNKGKKSSSASCPNKPSNNTSGSEDEVGADNESHHSSTVSNKTSTVTTTGTSTSAQRKYRKEMTSEERNHARVLRLTEVEAEFDKHVNIKDISCHLLDIDQEGINAIYYYWILKRKSGNNRPLLPPKSDDVEILSHTQEQADVEKLKSFVHLRQDLERVRNLCYMVSRREKLSRSFFKMREQTFHKQLAVLTDMKSHHRHNDDLMQNYETVITAVLAANHGPCIYDQLYSSTSGDMLMAASNDDGTGMSGSVGGNYKHKDMETLLDNLLFENLSSSVENICGGSGVEIITKNSSKGSSKSSSGKQQKLLKSRRNSSDLQTSKQKQNNNSNSNNSSMANSASKRNNNNKTNSSFNSQKRRPSTHLNGTLSTRSGTLYGSSSSATSCTSDDDTDNSSNTNHSIKMLMPPPRTSSSSCSEDEDMSQKKVITTPPAPIKPLPKSKKNKTDELAQPVAPRGRGRPPKVVPKIDKTRLTDSSSDNETTTKAGGKNSGDNLRQFERAIMFGEDVHLTDSNESDELDVPNKNLQSLSKNKMLSTKIYSSDTDDSSAGGGSSFTTDKEKTDNAATSDSQQHLVRTKAAMKEFNMHAAAASTQVTSPSDAKRRQSTDNKKSYNKTVNKVRKDTSPEDKKLGKVDTKKAATEKETLRKKLELEKENQKKLDLEKEVQRKKWEAAEKEDERKRVELDKEQQRKKMDAEKEVQRKKQQDLERELQFKKLETEKEKDAQRKKLELEKHNQKKKLEQEKDSQRKKLLEIEKEKENQKRLATTEASSDINVDYLVVPQRQAAKKAVENLTRSGPIGSTNSTTAGNAFSRRDRLQSDDSAPSSATRDEQQQQSKENLKESNKEAIRKDAKKPISKPLKLHQKDKSRKTNDDEINQVEDESEMVPVVTSKSGKSKSNKIENNFNNLAYVPQRQAAKKAQEHIKSGLGKILEGGVPAPASIAENKIPSKSQAHSKRTHGRKDSKGATSDVSSSDNSSSSSNSDSNDSHDDDDGGMSNSRTRDGIKKKNEGTERNNDLPFLDKAAKSIVSGSGTSESSDDTDDSDVSSSSANSSRSNQSASSKRRGGSGTTTTQNNNKKSVSISEDSRRKRSTGSTSAPVDKGRSPEKKKTSIRDTSPTKSLTSPSFAEGAKSRSQRPRRDSNRTGTASAVSTPRKEDATAVEQQQWSKISSIDSPTKADKVDRENESNINDAPAHKAQIEISTDKHGIVDGRKGDLAASEVKLTPPPASESPSVNRKRKSRYSSSAQLEDKPLEETLVRKNSVSPRKSPIKSQRDSTPSGTPTRTKADKSKDLQNLFEKETKEEPLVEMPISVGDQKSMNQENEQEQNRQRVEDKEEIKPTEAQKLVSIVIDDDEDDVKLENKSEQIQNKIDEKFAADIVSNASHCNLFEISSEELFQSAVEPINDDAFTISNDSLSAGGFSLSSSATANALKKDQEDEEDTARETLNLVEKLRQKKRKCSSAGVHTVDEKSSSSSTKDKSGKDEQQSVLEKEILAKTPRIDLISKDEPVVAKENLETTKSSPEDQKPAQPFDEARRWIPVVTANCNVETAPPQICNKTTDELHESNSNQSAIADINKMQNKLINAIIDYDDDKPIPSPYSYQRKWMECEIIAKRRSVSSSPASSNSDMVIDNQTSVEEPQMPKNSNVNTQPQQHNFGENNLNKPEMFEQHQQMFANLAQACQPHQRQQQHRIDNYLFRNSFMEAQVQQQHQQQFSSSGAAIAPFAPSGMNVQMPLPSPGQALYPPHMNNQSNMFGSTLNSLHQRQQMHQAQQLQHMSQDHQQQRSQQLQQLQQELHSLNSNNNNNNNNNIDYSTTTSAAFTSSSQNLAFTTSIVSPVLQEQPHENLNQQQQQQQQPQQQQHSIFDNKKNKTPNFNNSSAMNMHLQEENRMNAPNDLFSGAGTGSTLINNTNVASLTDFNNQTPISVANKTSTNKYSVDKIAVVQPEEESTPLKPTKQQQKAADKKANEYEEYNNKTANNKKSSNAKVAKTPKSGSQSNKPSNKRGSRGRGRSTSIHHHVPQLLPFSDYGLTNENTMQHIAGTVYDFDDEIEHEEENRPTRYRKKSKEFASLDSTLRSLASSGDTTPAATSMSPKLPNVNIQLKVRNSDFKSITSLHNSLNNTSLMETNNSIISPIIDMVLPGPVDMRTYSDDYDTTATPGGNLSTNVEQPAYTNPLDRFSSEPASDIYEEIKELQSAMKPISAAGKMTPTIEALTVHPQKSSPITKATATLTVEKVTIEHDTNTTVLPVDEVSIDSDYQPNPKVSLSNQLKLKIKGPLAHPDYYTSAALSSSSSTTTSSTFNHHATTKHTIESASVADHSATCNAIGDTIASSHHVITLTQSNASMQSSMQNASGGSSNLRRMRKKELLRQYWTQDANADEQNGGVPIGSEHQLNAAVPNRVCIPKAVDSMSSLPTKDDYNYDEFIDKKKRKINRELRHIEAYLQDPNSGQERRRSTSSSNGGVGGNNNLAMDTSEYNKRRFRYNRSIVTGVVNASNQQVTPKLKIKIGEEYTNETPLSGLRPPKKRINATIAAVVPSLEDLKRESMAYRKQMMANFDVEKKSKKHSRSKEERREEKRKKKKEKKKQRVEIINNELEHSPKLIIKFGIRNKKLATDAETKPAVVTPPPTAAGGQEASVGIAPIRLKISKKGINYVAKKSEDKPASTPPSPPASISDTIATVFVANPEDDLKTAECKPLVELPVDVPSKDPNDPLNTSTAIAIEPKSTKLPSPTENVVETGKCTDR